MIINLKRIIFFPTGYHNETNFLITAWQIKIFCYSYRSAFQENLIISHVLSITGFRKKLYVEIR
jgi:hypothetical protein